MKRRLWSCLCLSLVACATFTSVGVADDGPPPSTLKPVPARPTLDHDKLEKQFAEQLSGATLVGSYTTDGNSTTDRSRGKSPRVGTSDESYEISKVAKAPDGDWLFLVRMKFGDVDMKVPLKIPVKWAGDTPIISLSDFTIPGLGTFTARVIIYRDRYAGTWQHDQVGGHLFGRIVRAKKKAADEAKK